MASHLTHGQLIIQDENFDIHSKNLVAGGRSKPPTKKGGTELGCLKALNDLTIKSALHHEASSRKMNLSEEEFNIEDDMFLHDHEKCIEEQLMGEEFNIEDDMFLHDQEKCIEEQLMGEEFNIEDDMFLHDHEKCIEEQLMGTCLWDAVLSGHDSVSHSEDSVTEQTEADPSIFSAMIFCSDR
ncbi:hypothetical protein U1Q18_017705 [Sarracenia purpurea var. burkii]